MFRFLVLVSLTVFVSVSSIAQSNNEVVDTSLLIDDIIISQNRLSLPVSESARSIRVINREEINNLPVTNIPELLQFVGAVDIRRRGINGVQSDAGIRGSTFNQVLVLINGVRMSDPQTGHHMMNLPVALEDIERIEIVKGPAARIFGMNAMAGAINIITKSDASDKFKVKASATYSAHETYGVNVTANMTTGIVDHSLSVSRQGSEGYRFNTDYNINTVFYQSNIDKGDSHPIAIQAGYTEREFGANGFYANEDFIDQYEEVRTGFVSATTSIVANNLVIKPRLSWRTNKDDYVFLRDDPSFFMNNHKSNSYIAELHASYNSSYGTSGIGIDVARETLESNNLGDQERTILGLFAEHRFSFLNDKFNVTAGFYANKISEIDFSVYPGIDINYKVSKGVNLFATANWSDRIPTYTNLFYTSSVEQGNENLVAESATAFEVGVKANVQNASISLSGFVRNNKDLIDWAKDSITQQKWIALNFNQVNIKGIDFDLLYDLGTQFKLPNKASLRLNYTLISGEIIDDENIALSRSALDNLSNQFIATLNFNIWKDLLSLNTNYRYLDRVTLGDYSLVDMRLNYKGKKFAAWVSGNNLGDTEYRETNLVPMPGRWFGVGVRFW